MALHLIEDSTSTDTSTDTSTSETTTSESTETTDTTSTDLMNLDGSDTTATTKTETTTEDAKTYANGKYKSVDDLEKGYTELFKAMSSKEIPDDVLKAKAIEKGFYHEVPEHYGDLKKAFTDAGFSVEGTEDHEEWNTLHTSLKEAGVSQKSFDYLLNKVFAPWVAAYDANLIASYKIGLPPEEKATLVQQIAEKWGSNYKAEHGEIVKWAQANLNPVIFNKPLSHSVEGMSLLRDLYMKNKSANGINGSGEGNLSEDVMVLDKQLTELMQSDSYRKSSHPDYSTAQSKADLLMRQLQKLRNG